MLAKYLTFQETNQYLSSSSGNDASVTTAIVFIISNICKKGTLKFEVK